MSRLRTPVLLCVAVLLLPLPDRWARSDEKEKKLKPLTEFRQPLHDREEELLEIRDEFVRLLQASEPEDDAATEKRDKEIETCGRKLLTSGLAFQSTLQKFLAGKTRRGLGEEIDRVRNSVQLIQEMLVQYRRLAGHTVTPFTPGSADHKQLRAWWIDLLRKELQWRIALRFDDAGVRDIFTQDSVAEALKATLEHLESLAFRPVEEQMKALTGLAFHDARSLRRAAKGIINRTIAAQIKRLFVSLGSKKLVIKIGTKILVPWAQQAFWSRVVPHIKRALRQRGDQEQRIKDSVKGLKKIRLRLLGLPRDAKLAKVRAELKQAQLASTATGYLRKDLLKASKMDKFIDLLAALAQLEHAMGRTRLRFLLDKEDLVAQLKLDSEICADALNELARLLRRRKPKTSHHQILFLSGYHFPSDKGPVDPPRLSQAYTGYASFDPVLYYVDRRLLKDYRKELREIESPNAEASLEELYASHSGLATPYRKDWSIRIVCGDQIIHRHSVYGEYDDRHFGLAKLHGLKPGLNKIAATVTTSEGLRTDMIIPIMARISPDYAKALAKKEKEIAQSRKYGESQYTGKASIASLAAWAGRHASLLNYKASLLRDCGHGAADRLAVAKQMLTLADVMAKPDSETSPLPCLANALVICSEVGNADAFTLATSDILSRLTAQAKALGDDGPRVFANVYHYLANLAISSGNKIGAARDYYTKHVKLAMAAGDEMDLKLEQSLMPKRWDIGK